MFLLDWLWGLLSLVPGRWPYGPSSRVPSILLLGLDDAGKTTLIHKLKADKLKSPIPPTLYPHAEEVLLAPCTPLRMYDLGGHQAVRSLWRQYYSYTDGIIFIVDASNRCRLIEARDLLHSLLEEDALRSVPILVLGNKADVAGHASEDEMRGALDLNIVSTTGSHLAHDDDDDDDDGEGVRPIRLYMTSMIHESGELLALRWLVSKLDRT
eukprot:TRINITY_DN10991_c1_g1_i1.p1 TRINITY_DN10991_c1_g1~~TRINITY_DN10991_c1_g1_i1.p1  ORF type:complete len:234 (-),score=26.32 TRINITY_DN10991_c1_g1_i1:252-884(-)